MKRIALIFVLFASSLLSAQSPNPYVTLGGKLQGPNGLPASNQILSFTPTQSFFVAGLGSASCNSYTIEINGTGLVCSDAVNFNNTTPAAPTNGLNIQWQTSKSGITDSVSGAIVGNGVSSDCLSGIGTYVPCNGTGSVGGSGTGGFYPDWSGSGSSTTLGNSPLSNVTSPSGINYSLGSGVYWQLDASGLNFNSSYAVGSTNILIQNSYSPGSGTNAGGVTIRGANTSGSACGGPVTLLGGGTSSNGSTITAGGGCSNGFGGGGSNIALTAGSASGSNSGGSITLTPGTGSFGNGTVQVANGFGLQVGGSQGITAVQGSTGTKFLAFSGSFAAANDVVTLDSHGNAVDSGGGLSSGSTAYGTPSASTNATIASTNMVAAGSSGDFYTFEIYLTQTGAGTGCSGNTTLLPEILWFDPNNSTAFANQIEMSAYNPNQGWIPGAVIAGNGAVGTVFTIGPVPIRAKASSNVNYAVAVTPDSSCSVKPTYQAYPILILNQ